MKKDELKQMIRDRVALAEKAFNTYQQIQGQISLLREMYMKMEQEEAEDKKSKKLPKENK